MSGGDLKNTPLGPVNVPAVLVALLAGLIIGVVAQPIFASEPEPPTPATPVRPAGPGGNGPTGPDDGRATPVAGTAALQRALARGVAKAEKMGGSAAVAVAAPDFELTEGSVGPYRMWSTSKVLTSLILLSRLKPNEGVPPEIEDALVRSSNCAQRLIVNEIQDRLGGIEAAKRAFVDEAAKGRAKVDASTIQDDPPDDSTCDAYLSAAGIGDPQRPTALFGPAEWTVGDAARFMYSLGSGAFGPVGDEVLLTMKEKKQVNQDEGADNSVVAALDWGAGEVFGEVPYKAGWGMTRDEGLFTASQMAVMNVGGRPVGVAAVFTTTGSRESEALGEGREAEAIEAMFERVRKGLERVENGGGDGN
mgnify:CR=1 FL=1